MKLSKKARKQANEQAFEKQSTNARKSESSSTCYCLKLSVKRAERNVLHTKKRSDLYVSKNNARKNRSRSDSKHFKQLQQTSDSVLVRQREALTGSSSTRKTLRKSVGASKLYTLRSSNRSKRLCDSSRRRTTLRYSERAIRSSCASVLNRASEEASGRSESTARRIRKSREEENEEVISSMKSSNNSSNFFIDEEVIEATALLACLIDHIFDLGERNA
jgi:hypothetical protein